jgi:propanol-preferring alcohol dehydrogenase
MKGWVLEKQDRIEQKPLKLLEIPTPHATDNQIRIKILACGVCRTDVHIVEGDLPLKKSNLILGHQVVGIVDEAGKNVRNFRVGDRAGVPWLNHTCGRCKFCFSNKENLCPSARFTGYDVDGGFAEFITIDGNFAYHLGEKLSPVEIAPLLCGGVIGFRALRLSEAGKGERLGIYGFGSSASMILQVAKNLGVEAFVITRKEEHRKLAKRLGADWTGNYDDTPPEKLDASIIFAPAGEIVPKALSHLEKGGKLILAGIYMTPFPKIEYKLIWGERCIKSVANSTREDVRDFLNIADKIKVKTRTEIFSFEQLQDAMKLVKEGKINGSAVIKISG